MEDASRIQDKSKKTGKQIPVFTRGLLIHTTVLIKCKTNFTTEFKNNKIQRTWILDSTECVWF
jgi:hypothetical protein